MCNFFSFVGDGYGNYLYSSWEERKKDLSMNWDSHTFILTNNHIPPEKQDRWSKYEYNPLLKEFTIDEPGDWHDHEAARNWVEHLNFKQIIPALIIKPILYPLTGEAKQVTEQEKELLRHWASVWDSVWGFVGASVWASVGGSVGDSVKASVWDSVKASVGGSVKASVGGSVWAYYSSFFDIKFDFDFSPVVELWKLGFVPSFDGTIWRVHSGADARVVYSMSSKELEE